MSNLKKISFDGTDYGVEGVVDASLTQQGIAADAKAVGDALRGATGLSDEVKQALLDCFANVAWANAYGESYYDALEEALYAEFTITNNLDNVTNSNSATTIREGGSYNATLTATSGSLIQVSVTMGGVDITSSVFTPSS